MKKKCGEAAYVHAMVLALLGQCLVERGCPSIVCFKNVMRNPSLHEENPYSAVYGSDLSVMRTMTQSDTQLTSTTHRSLFLFHLDALQSLACYIISHIKNPDTASPSSPTGSKSGNRSMAARREVTLAACLALTNV